MSNVYDDDPPIKTGPASQAYRDNWEANFGEKKEPTNEYGDGSAGDVPAEPDPTEVFVRQRFEVLCTQDGYNARFPIDEKPPAESDVVETLETYHKDDSDAIECKLVSWGYWCEVCKGHFVEPHLYGHVSFPANMPEDVQLNWRCPCCYEFRYIVAIDRETRVFDCQSRTALDTKQHGFDDPRHEDKGPPTSDK